jgi:hypothetical protein
MKTEMIGAVASRAVGVGLIVMAVCSALFWPFFSSSGMATSGWTSYSPPATTTDPLLNLKDAYYVVSSVGAGYLPNLAQILAGVVMIILCRPIGRWLAKGLTDRENGGNE